MYSPLNACRKEIRLLHVHPGAWNDDVECHLETVSLNDNPKFYAISYVWGDPNITLPITIDGKPLAITRNLCNGLQRLRKTDETLVIYADAACINQSDVNERSQQVQLMGEIYSSAQEVFIWLGYGRESQAPLQRPNIVPFAGDDSDMEIVDAYFKVAHSLDQENNEGKETEDVLGLFVYLAIRAMDWHIYQIPFFTLDKDQLHTKQAWAAVVRAAKTLESNLWWTRIWVIQETVLARHVNVVYCNITIPWTVITNSVDYSNVHDNQCCNVLQSSLPYRHKVAMSLLEIAINNGVGYLKKTRQQGIRLSLGVIMRRTDMFDATDVRDKVFAVLGLVTDWQGNPPTVPDYNLPPKEVFIQATIRDIQGTSSMRALIGINTSEITRVPSWLTETSLMHPRDSILAQIRFTHSTMYRVAGHTKASIERQGDILVIDAFEPSHAVSKVGPLVYGPEFSWEAVANSVNVCQHMVEFEQQTQLLYPEKKRREEALWRTTTNDRYEWHPSDHTRIGRKGFYQRTLRRFGDVDVAALGAEFLRHIELQVMSSKTQITNCKDDFGRTTAVRDCWYRTSWRRRFFITQNGHMGLGPPHMLPGDIIAILLGGNVPFCLRNVPDAPKGHYTLVGDIYVHDLMDGEGVPPNWEEHVVKIHLH
ncbi:hypothetical protein AG0111_0g1732 [Alternaria gaisen]|uniref:Uncharacterized protein n=1 Tax=Alternaria gaisen TaxID=167740 RepID=A0ACB6G4T8_9PLEO|nr:hypothetical protein AG0111_0g1732 [Alternaria gaisen]